MPITLSGSLATFQGTCAVEEAEQLLEWLRQTASPRIDLSGCEHLHTAILQTLLAARPAIAAPIPDALVARLLSPLPPDPAASMGSAEPDAIVVKDPESTTS